MIIHYIFVLVSWNGQQTAALYFHVDDVHVPEQVFMVKLLRMQKRPSFSATKDEICDVQNEPIVQKLFEDAVEVLRLAGAYEKDTGKVSALAFRLFHFLSPPLLLRI